MTEVSRLYGLTVRSQLPLHQQRPPAADAEIDLEIALGSTMARIDDPPPGRMMLHLEVERQHYSATETGDGYRLRFYGTCDVTLDAQARCVVVHPVAGADLDVVSVLIAGSVLAFVLAEREVPVLHASAVQIGGDAGGAVAFVGGSGMGKSTMATMLCAHGGLLITDDLLRLDLGEDPPTCAPGATELRLRKAAGDLTGLFEIAPGRRRTGDARDALATPLATGECIPLRALVVPLPDRSTTHPATERLAAKDAFLLLSRFPRLLGWQDAKIITAQFHQLGAIADRVPVHVATLPWGPPFSDGVVNVLLSKIGLTAGELQR